MKKLNSYIMCV